MSSDPDAGAVPVADTAQRTGGESAGTLTLTRNAIRPDIGAEMAINEFEKWLV